MTDLNYVGLAKKYIKAQIETLERLLKRMDKNLKQEFKEAVDIINTHLSKPNPAKVVFTGVGKSGLIGKKLAATFTSLGLPAVFIHSTEALHGDLGIIKGEDVVVALSYSGETSEVLTAIRALEGDQRPTLIVITGNSRSTLAKEARVVLDIGVRKEADPRNLAPTSSTTAMLVLGDALALVLADIRGFTKEDFAKYHPGGSLGKRLKNRRHHQ